MEARGANNFDNHNAIYEMKKAALGAALNWPAGQIPIVGGTIQDVTIRGMIGVEPTPESVAANAPTVTVADVMNQTNFYIAEDLVRNDPNLGEMSKYVHADGTLMKPEEIDANLQRDYYFDMEQYIEDRGSDNAMNTIYQEYQNAGGINIPKGFTSG